METFRSSALRSSQNSLQSSITGPQRPSSAYYPPSAVPAVARSNLHQSIPNLKSPSTQRIQNEDARSGSYPSVNQQYPQNYGGNMANAVYGERQNINYNPQQHQAYLQGHYARQQEESAGRQYSGGPYLGQKIAESVPYTGQKISESGPYVGQKVAESGPYVGQKLTEGGPYAGQKINDVGSYTGQKINEAGPYHSPVHSATYGTNQQPLQVHTNGQRHEQHYNMQQHSQVTRGEEMMRYPSSNNIRIAEAQIQQNKVQDELNRQNEMRMSKSEDMLRQYTNNHNEILRYASSGNVRSQESNRVDLKQNIEDRSQKEEMRNARGQAKMAEMSEEVRRRQNRNYYQQQSAFPVQGNPNYYQQQQQYYNQHQPQYPNPQSNYNPNVQAQILQNTQSMQNLTLTQQTYPNHHPQQNNPYYQQNPANPNFQKTPPVAPKPVRKVEEPPELPPTSTHPLYSASSQDPPKMALYPNNNGNNVSSKPPRDPWAREEQERQAEVRREQARQWQEQQIRELLSLGNRTQQQEEQLRVLQLEREFQRRALEAAEQDDEDTEKVSKRKYTKDCF